MFENQNLENVEKKEEIANVSDTEKNLKQNKDEKERNDNKKLVKESFEKEVKSPDNTENKNDKAIQNKIFVSDDSNLRRSALFNAESDLYRVKFDEYAGIPDCIVNEIFNINDGKGKISIEEAVIMLMNLIPRS